MYRKDLPLYDVPKSKTSCKKRKFAIKVDEQAPPVKKRCIDKQKPKRKLSLQKESVKTNPPKKIKQTLIRIMMTVFIPVQKVMVSVPRGLICDTTLSMKSGNDKHAIFGATI